MSEPELLERREFCLSNLPKLLAKCFPFRNSHKTISHRLALSIRYPEQVQLQTIVKRNKESCWRAVVEWCVWTDLYSDSLYAALVISANNSVCLGRLAVHALSKYLTWPFQNFSPLGFLSRGYIEETIPLYLTAMKMSIFMTARSLSCVIKDNF